MSVSNYTINNCKYTIGKLDKVLYLVDKSSLGNVDTQDYYIDGGAQATMIKCNSISLTENTNLDERYKFTHTINFQVDGYKTVADFNERYYAVVKDMDGEYYLVNPEFKMKITYNFAIDATGSHTDFQLSTVSDYPLLKVNNFAPWASAGSVAVDGSIYKWVNITPTSSNTTYICDSDEDDFVCKPYSNCSIDTIMINETNYSTYSDGFAHYTNDGFKKIEFIKNTASFSEEFDGNNVKHTLKFSIPYDNSSWHNYLLDFKDNKYCAIITTKCDKSIACGFQHGLRPTYTITGSNSESNKIEITLSDLHDQGQLIIMNDLINTSGNSSTTWVWVENEYECVDNSTAKHLLMEEYDIYGNPMDLYKCLEGYRIDYEWLADKLVGEFEDTESIYFTNGGLCYDTECSLTTTLTDMTFYDTSTKYFKVYCNKSDWSMTSSSNDISFSPISGEAGIEYTVSITNGITPTSTSQHEVISVYFCDGEYSTQFGVEVKERPLTDCFPQGATYNVSQANQTLTIPAAACVGRVLTDNGFVNNIQVQDGYIKLNVNESLECSARTATLTCTMCDSTVESPHIHELYVVQAGNDCTSSMLTCEYSGGTTYTVPCIPSKTVDSSQMTASTAPLANTMSSCTIGDCAKIINAYAFSYCTNLSSVTIGSGVTTIGNNAFNACTALTSVTVNATTPPDIGVSIFNNNLQHIYVDCAYVTAYKSAWSDYASKIEAIAGTCPEYNRTTSGTPYCTGLDKYIDVYYQVSNDGGSTWNTVTTTKVLLEENSTDCGYVPPQPVNYNTQPFTLVALETSTFMFKASTIKNLPAMQYSIDSGTTWTIMLESTTPIVQAGNKIMFRGTCSPYSFFGIGKFESSGKFNVEGNIMSLIYGDNFIGQTSLSGKDYVFINLFSGDANLIGAENLILPATTLSYMCYSGLFYNCTKLETAPVLSATTLANACYMSLFQECTSLNSITCLATDISAQDCTTSWVKNVASSGTFYKNPSMSSWTSGKDGIPNNWTVENYS